MLRTGFRSTSRYSSLLRHTCSTGKFSTCLVVAEHDSQSISQGTLSAITAASKICGNVNDVFTFPIYSRSLTTFDRYQSY